MIVDSFRNKMKTTILNSVSAAAEADENSSSSVVPASPPRVNAHFETRIGKKRWLAGKKKAAAAAKSSDDESDGERR